jgi:hypothetical protein
MKKRLLRLLLLVTVFCTGISIYAVNYVINNQVLVYAEEHTFCTEEDAVNYLNNELLKQSSTIIIILEEMMYNNESVNDMIFDIMLF